MLRAQDNPFRSERLHGLRYRLREDAWRSLEETVAAAGFRGAVVGPHGSGKTTLLEGLAKRLQRRGARVHWLELHTYAPALSRSFHEGLAPRLGQGDVVMLDGAEQLNPFAWWRFRWSVRQVGSVLITTHRPGRFATVFRCETSERLVQELVSELGAEISGEEAARLLRLYRGNVREVFRTLYDQATESTHAPATGRDHEFV